MDEKTVESPPLAFKGPFHFETTEGGKPSV